MKQRFLAGGCLLLLMVILAACGGRATSSDGMDGMNMGGSSTVATTVGTPSENALMTTVQVTETDFKIASVVTSFTPGTSYHFVVKNVGKTAHEFMIMPKLEGSMGGMPMGEMDKMALARIETIAPGETKTVDYIFPASMAGSHPEFACYLPGHYEAGMKLGVAVKA